MYALADRYDIPDLASHASGNFLRALPFATPKEVFNSVAIVFEGTPFSDRDLKDPLIRHLRELAYSGLAIQRAEVQGMLDEMEDFKGMKVGDLIANSVPEAALYLLIECMSAMYSDRNSS